MRWVSRVHVLVPTAVPKVELCGRRSLAASSENGVVDNFGVHLWMEATDPHSIVVAEVDHGAQVHFLRRRENSRHYHGVQP